MKTNQSSIQEAALFFTLCAFIALAACSKPGSKDAGHDSDAPLQGTLLLTGSSTMAPLISDIAKRFELAHPNVQITVKTGGSMRGVQDAREGVADIGMASRALTAAESDLSGLPMARDGICLLVNKDNPVQSLTDAQVAAIYIGSVTNWKNVGGLDEPITVITRAEGRSELDLFLGYFKIKTTEVKAQSETGDNVLAIRAVSDNKQAINFVSIGESERAAQNGTPIRLLPISGIAASSKTVRTGDYPLSRALTLVTKGTPTGLAEKFLDFCLSSQATDLIRQRGFVPYLD
jgi:phosphate transport system substrate-binding protein